MVKNNNNKIIVGIAVILIAILYFQSNGANIFNTKEVITNIGSQSIIELGDGDTITKYTPIQGQDELAQRCEILFHSEWDFDNHVCKCVNNLEWDNKIGMCEGISEYISSLKEVK